MARTRAVHAITTIAVVAGLMLSLLPAGPASSASGRHKLPVPYDFLVSAVLGGLEINGNAPGANKWGCQPTQAHPRPVVLVHGLMGNRSTNWQTYAPLLKNHGYCVFAITYGVPRGTPQGLDQFGGRSRMQASSKELKRFVNRVLRATGARQVDIVGHSEGTVIPNYYAKFLGGRPKIHRYVSLAPLWHGTNPAGLATLSEMGAPYGGTALIDQAMSRNFASGRQLLTHSAFMKKMRRGGTPVVKGIRYTNIVTKYDELVSPYTSGVQRGMKNYVVQDFCDKDYAEHFQIAADPVAARLVLNTLDPAHRKKVPCRLVLPFVGG